MEGDELGDERAVARPLVSSQPWHCGEGEEGQPEAGSRRTRGELEQWCPGERELEGGWHLGQLEGERPSGAGLGVDPGLRQGGD